MQLVFSILAGALNLYTFLILIRIVISWFSKGYDAKPVQLLGRVTDPYLDWWRNNLNLRFGFIDLSPIVAIAALSFCRSIIHSISVNDRITIGNILAIVLISVWSIVTFILGFFIIVLVLRIFAYLTNRDIYGPFWRAVDSISQPVLYRTNRIIFGNKIPPFMKGILLSTLALAGLWAAGGFLIPLFSKLLSGLPL